MPADVEVIEKENKVGRPELFPTVILPRFDDIYEWISEGHTEKSICKKLGIHPATWIEYKNKYNELAELIIRARSAAGELLLNKQFAAGCGQVVTLNKQKVTKDGDVVDYKEEAYIPPNTNAADFWGRHMMPEYKAPKQVESGNITINNFQLPEKVKEIEQLDKEITELEKRLAVDVEAIPTE